MVTCGIKLYYSILYSFYINTAQNWGLKWVAGLFGESVLFSLGIAEKIMLTLILPLVGLPY